MVEYVHMGYASTYSKYWLLEIENGDLNEARKYKNKEFVRFKKRQFEQFKKTDEYKKLYAELKKNDNYGDDEFIQSFIKDFVINYTTKFLTE
jgi:pyruvate/2-oxoacid:ferredoxin oxidoreductase beta subunit